MCHDIMTMLRICFWQLAAFWALWMILLTFFQAAEHRASGLKRKSDLLTLPAKLRD